MKFLYQLLSIACAFGDMPLIVLNHFKKYGSSSHTNGDIFYSPVSKIPLLACLLRFQLNKIINKSMVGFLFKEVGQPGYRIIILVD